MVFFFTFCRLNSKISRLDYSETPDAAIKPFMFFSTPRISPCKRIFDSTVYTENTYETIYKQKQFYGSNVNCSPHR